MDEPTGELLRGRYEPRAELGSGGQGTVLLAFDHQHQRQVALKVRQAGSLGDRERLLGEARTLLSLRPHAGLPVVRDDFFVDEDYVLVMDWVEGESLAGVLAARGDPGLAPSVVLGYLAQLAQALDHLHAHRPPVVHGDVKPANVILTPEGRVVLVDFGIVGVEAPVGTAGYLAPEVARGEPRTPAADVYGLAATAVALLTGEPPQHGRPSWDGLDPNVVGALERGVRRGLATEPSRRPGSATELMERLRNALGGSLPTGVVTFCLTDIEGSTPLWDAHPDAMGEVIARTEAVIADAVEARGGRVIKARGEGDSTLSVFVRATDAAQAAVALQLALHQDEWSEGVVPRLRVALHTGEAELREGDYYGQALNRAARLRDLAAGGHIVCSRATADLVADALPAGATLVELGRRELRGLSRNEAVYALEHPDFGGGRSSDALRAEDPHRTPDRRLEVPETRYASRADGRHIGYQVFGDGPVDLVFCWGFISHLDLQWTNHDIVRFYERLATFSRVIVFDKVGTGLSDPIDRVPTLEDRADDIVAVMDAVACERAVLFGESEAGPTAVLFSTMYPERVSALILFGSIVKGTATDDDFADFGIDAASLRSLWAELDEVVQDWGKGRTLELLGPSVAGLSAMRRVFGTYERAAVSPAMARALIDVYRGADVSGILDTVKVPTLVMHRVGDWIPVQFGRYLATHIAGASYAELDGDDHIFFLGDQERVLDETERFVTGARTTTMTDRVLATVLFTHVVGSPPPDGLDHHVELVSSRVGSSHGRVVRATDGDVLAVFPGPARAIRCAAALVAELAAQGIEIRAGIHTGECEVAGDDVSGVAVDVGAQIAAHASGGEVLVSSTVKELVTGSGLEFTDRGRHELSGVPDDWQLFALGRQGRQTPLPSASATMTLADRLTVRLARRAPGAMRAVGRLATRSAPPPHR